MQKTKQSRSAGKPGGRSIFSHILTALLVVLCAELLLMVLAIWNSSVIQKLDQNAVDILNQQVFNRTAYLQRRFLEAQKLDDVAAQVNGAAEELLAKGAISLDTLDQSSENAQPLMDAIVPQLVAALRTKGVNGIFVILSTHDLEEKQEGTCLPCVYLRDLDPDATSSDRNADLMVARGTAQTVQQLGITTDKCWGPAMEVEPGCFFWTPFQVAYQTVGSKAEAANYGRWTPQPYVLERGTREAIAYVQPLILPDGTVYGVIGIDLLVNYLEQQLPADELQHGGQGSYLLAVTRNTVENAETLEVTAVLTTGKNKEDLTAEKLRLERDAGSWKYTLGKEQQRCSIQPLSLYSRNTPFANETWLILGAVEENALFAFSHQVWSWLLLAVAATAAVGVLGCFMASRQLAKPVAQLSAELAAAQKEHGSIPEFSCTGIRELDQFASAITQLSRDNRMAEALERRRIEHERDYDILTGLYNRQAFRRACEELFAHPEKLGHAALVMTDLDNLKQINDTYGHDWGDQYLRQTGRCLAQNVPAGTLCARLSGDEFLLFFYGYRSRGEIRRKLEELREALHASTSTLPNGSELHISISAGVAWYPKDSTNYNTLKKYADFAMYQVKHSEKGEMREFDVGVYNQEACAQQTRNEFEEMLRQEAVDYYFQPIFSARSGRVVAYEALMRPQMPTLRSPLAVLKLARELGRLYDIERLTVFKASEAFQDLRRKGLIREDALLFVNSIANVSLNDADIREYNRLYGDLLPDFVVEITEEEELNLKELERKRYVPGASGTVALDDYGSGYSNGNSLLTIEPRYVKVDISIIRNIDTNMDKQQFLTGLVTYAKPRSIQVLAEGVETMAELQKVLELGVDLLQGYGCARPAPVPGPIAPEAMDVLRKFNERKRWMNL
mgnify:FL=1